MQCHTDLLQISDASFLTLKINKPQRHPKPEIVAPSGSCSHFPNPLALNVA